MTGKGKQYNNYCSGCMHACMRARAHTHTHTPGEVLALKRDILSS